MYGYSTFRRERRPAGGGGSEAAPYGWFVGRHSPAARRGLSAAYFSSAERQRLVRSMVEDAVKRWLRESGPLSGTANTL